MLRRLFVPVILAALTLGAAPDPAFGLGSGERQVRLRAGDHLQCMYRCAERGLEPPTRRYGWGSWPRPRPRPRPPARPSGNRPGCWLFCGHDGWYGHSGWWGYGGWWGNRGYDAHRHHPRGRDF